jgi:hypothetical protein
MSIKATPANILASVDVIAAKVARGEPITLDDFKAVPVTDKYSKDAKKAGISSVLVTSNVNPNSSPKGEKATYPVTDEYGNKLVNVFGRKHEPITKTEFKDEIHKTTAKKSGTPRGQAFIAAYKEANPTHTETQQYEAFLALHKTDLANELAARKALYKHHSIRLYADKCKAEGKIFDDDTGNWKIDQTIKEAEKAAKKAAKAAAKVTTPTPAPALPPTDGNESDGN